MYYIFESDGTYRHSVDWPQSNKLKEGTHQYVLQQEANRQLWYLNRRYIGPIGMNLSDVPPQYIKIAQMLNLILPKE